jgi:hypothetical protein
MPGDPEDVQDQDDTALDEVDVPWRSRRYCADAPAAIRKPAPANATGGSDPAGQGAGIGCAEGTPDTAVRQFPY